MKSMGAVPRIDLGGHIYHAYNRGNAGGELFRTAADYAAFERMIAEAQKRTQMRIVAYCIMPNHWHFVLWPRKDGDVGAFFHWLGLTHTKRWHAYHGSTGQGHIYQGTYKSNLVQSDEHALTLIRYVERNALRAKLVARAEDWRWSSAWRRKAGSKEEKALLSEWPVDMPQVYLEYLNEPQTAAELDAIRHALKRGSPYGEQIWSEQTASHYGLEATLRPRGRPRKRY